MRILVMGAGGTGGFFGAKLARAGEDVTFVARGAHLAAIQAGGLRVTSTVEGEWTVRAPAVERVEGLAPADLVLFCVKSFDTEAAADLVRPAVGPATGVLSIQNGVDNEDRLAARLGGGHVIGGVALVFATIAAPGVIAHSLLGRLAFGEMDGQASPRTRAFLAACERAGIPAELAPDPRRALWEKYVFLVAHAGLTAVTRCPAGVLRGIPETRRLYRAALEEMLALGRAEGVAFEPDAGARFERQWDGLGANAYSSLHHDLVHGRRLELEALHGHAVRLGERHRVPTPALFGVYAALKPHVGGAPTVS